MALFDALLTHGGGVDPEMADAGTAENLRRKKFPGLLFDAPASASPDGNSIPPPDVGQSANVPPQQALNVPWLPGYRAPSVPRPSLTTPTGQIAPGTNKAQKLEVLIRGGLQGAIAGRAASEQAVIQSGGHRSGGFGTGFEAAQQLPIQRAMQEEDVHRAQMQNQQLQQQVQNAPLLAQLGIGEKVSTINRNQSEAVLNQARTAAERYKSVGGLLYDMQADGGPQPIKGTAAGAFIPADQAMADLAGIPKGQMLPIAIAKDLREMANSGGGTLAVDQANQGLAQRYQVLNPGQQLPASFTLKPNATPKDFDRVDKLLQSTEQAQGTKALRDQSAAIRNQTLSMAQQNQQDREEKQGLTWVSWEDKNGRTVAGPLSQARAAGAKNPAAVPTEEIRNITDARQAVALINKQGDPNSPETMGVLQLANSLQKDGKMGVFASRYNNFLTKGVGASPGDDPRIVTLLDKSQLLMTLAMKAHFGASGGRSPQMLEHFISMANAGKMDAQTFIGGAKAVGNYMEDRAMMQRGTIKMQAPNGQFSDVSPDQVEYYKSLGAKVAQ
jgi:hypothetical protein